MILKENLCRNVKILLLIIIAVAVVVFSYHKQRKQNHQL